MLGRNDRRGFLLNVIFFTYPGTMAPAAWESSSNMLQWSFRCKIRSSYFAKELRCLN
jgi:hypothetical protein